MLIAFDWNDPSTTITNVLEINLKPMIIPFRQSQLDVNDSETLQMFFFDLLSSRLDHEWIITIWIRILIQALMIIVRMIICESSWIRLLFLYRRNIYTFTLFLLEFFTSVLIIFLKSNDSVVSLMMNVCFPIWTIRTVVKNFNNRLLIVASSQPALKINCFMICMHYGVRLFDLLLLYVVFL